MTEIPPETEFEEPQSRITVIQQSARSGYDLIYGFFNHMGVQGVLTLAFILFLDYLSGWFLNPGVLMLGFFFIGGLSWLLFPHASWNWRITTDLTNRVVNIERITVEDSKKSLDDGKARRHFVDLNQRSVTVVGEHLALSEAHTISDMNYLADTTALSRALAQLPGIIQEYAVLKAHRGLEVSTLSRRAIEEVAKVDHPIKSDDIRGVHHELFETVDHKTKIPE